MRRFISIVFMLALFVLVGYNVRQVSLLRQEVEALKAGRRVSSEDTRALSLIAKARKHSDQAKEYILSGDLKRARVELDKGLQLTEQALRDSGAQSVEAWEKAQRSLQEARTALDRLRQKSEKEPDKGKGG